MSTDLTVEDRISNRIDSGTTRRLAISNNAGGLYFTDMSQAMEFAKLMAIGNVAVPKHLRGQVGACLAVVIQAIEWRMSPYAVANKSYSVNDRLAYESQLIHAVILMRAPIIGRLKTEFIGEGSKLRCKVWARLDDGSDETVDYISPEIDKIPVKNSPLWKGDPEQQLFYYSSRAFARRHFPDVILGVYSREELEPEAPREMRDVTEVRPSMVEALDRLAGPSGDLQEGTPHDPVTGEIIDPPKRTRAPRSTKGNADGQQQGGTLVVEAGADGKVRGSTAEMAAADRVVTTTGEVLKDKGSASAPTGSGGSDAQPHSEAPPATVTSQAEQSDEQDAGAQDDGSDVEWPPTDEEPAGEPDDAEQIWTRIEGLDHKAAGVDLRDINQARQYLAGMDAAHANYPRRSMPEDIRTEARRPEGIAWLRGHDHVTGYVPQKKT